MRDELERLESRSGQCQPSSRAGDYLGPVEEEIGDVLFAAGNLARFLRSDPESCLRRANRKFSQRFQALEQETLRRGKRISECSPHELDEIWTAVKGASR